MPQARRSSRGYGRKKGNQQNAAILVVAAIFIFITIYWLSQPAGPQKERHKDRETENVSSEDSGSGTSSELNHKKSVTKPGKFTAHTSAEKGILSAVAKLHIAEQEIKRKETDGEIIYSIPIDPSASDLTFANMIFKGEVERCNGSFQSGLVKGKRQVLTFSDPGTNKTYKVELFYKRNEDLPTVQDKILCIIIDDFGNQGGKLLNGFAKTDPAVCFAILPDTRYAEVAMNAASQAGHESLIHIPMEPINYPEENPGDNAIFIQHSQSENSRRVERFINKLPDCIGINNHMGSLATADEPTMQAVMQVLRKRNLIFVDSRTTNSTMAYNVAQKNMVTAFKRDIFLDEPDLSATNLDKKLAECLKLAQTKPYVLAIMHCHSDAHLAYLQKFIAKARQAGFQLAPLSSLSAYKLPAIL